MIVAISRLHGMTLSKHRDKFTSYLVSVLFMSIALCNSKQKFM